jgi:hypothetical protein
LIIQSFQLKFFGREEKRDKEKEEEKGAKFEKVEK